MIETRDAVSEFESHRPVTSPLRLAGAALIAVLGPWVVGMSIAFAQPGNRWSVEGGGAVLLGVVYLGGFGAVAAGIAGNYQIALGGLAGEAFALGSLGRQGGFIGAILSIGAGLAGGFIAQRVMTEDRPPGEDPRRPLEGTRPILIGVGISLALPIALISYGRYAAGTVTAALVFAAWVISFWNHKPATVRTWLAIMATIALLSVTGVAWGASVAARNAERIANRASPLEQVIGLRRGDGLTFGEFVRARYAKQTRCPLSKVRSDYDVYRQGPFKQSDGRFVVFYDIVFNGGDRCLVTGGFYIAVFAESIPPKVTGRIFVRDCETQRHMAHIFVPQDPCRKPISAIGRFASGELPSVDWLNDFRAGKRP